MHLITFGLVSIVVGFVGLLAYFWQHAKNDRAYLEEQRKKSAPGSPRF